MTYLVLRASNEVREQIANFERILEAYDIKILRQWENESLGTIEITTDAQGFPNTRSVKAVAYDCFGDGLIKFKSY